MGAYAILQDGVVVNIVVADAETAEANGWVEAVGQYAAIPSPVVVPESVTMAQARKALLSAGITAAMVSKAIAELEDDAAAIDWEYSTVVRRSAALVEVLGDALGLTDSEINSLFIQAAGL
jgi:ribosomal protein S16